ncbi:hypothetical protein Taro_041071 [Colocasia esculenta]|uniref:Uncharacterized protein n=1 Tax=Colocasia esculenta TaxID=4460 RepID=A0A843WKK4_COLES|nr:hypothetical protein [Colocasia esculenta]
MAAPRPSRASSRHVLHWALLIVSCLSEMASTVVAYRPGEIVPMGKAGQYHGVSISSIHRKTLVASPIRGIRSDFFSELEIAVKNRLAGCAWPPLPHVLIPIAKPTGYTGADPYKISFQVGHEKFLIPWLYVINRKSSEVPMIDVHLMYIGSDLHGVTAKIVDMPHQCM